MIKEKVIINRNGSNDLLLVADDANGIIKDVPQSLTGVIKVSIKNVDSGLIIGETGTGKTYIDSDDYPNNFVWSLNETGVIGKLLIKNLGLIEDINPGRYIVRLIIYDNENTDGISWDKFILEIEED